MYRDIRTRTDLSTSSISNEMFSSLNRSLRYVYVAERASTLNLRLLSLRKQTTPLLDLLPLGPSSVGSISVSADPARSHHVKAPVWALEGRSSLFLATS
jgi:hypothetical protein